MAAKFGTEVFFQGLGCLGFRAFRVFHHEHQLLRSIELSHSIQVGGGVRFSLSGSSLSQACNHVLWSQQLISIRSTQKTKNTKSKKNDTVNDNTNNIDLYQQYDDNATI